MGHRLTLTADDGHSFGAYRTAASGTTRGGIVVLQEIFGVNVHIRDVCDRFAADGFTCIAPALYDRSSRKDCELGNRTDECRTVYNRILHSERGRLCLDPERSGYGCTGAKTP